MDGCGYTKIADDRCCKMKKLLRTTFLAFFFFLYLLSPGIFHADAVKSLHAAEDSADLSEADTETDGDYGSTCAEFSFRGFIEFQTFFNTGNDLDFKDATKKNEIRNRLEIKYGTEDFFIFTVSDLYMSQTYLNDNVRDDYVYAKERGIARNLRISSRGSELCFNELYLNYRAENFRLRIGNQIYGWGTADAFNPTSYFNPYDLRELIFRDDDEEKAGVPSISGMFFMGECTLETVFVPVHIPTIMAPDGNFWSLNMDVLSVPVVFDDPQQLDADIGNCGYGARLSTVSGGLDISVSGYHGPDRDPVFLPYGITGVLPDLAILVKPETYVVSMFGLDLSATLGDFVVQFEAVYSPDKAGIVEPETFILPFEVDRSPCISYATGFNYFIPLNRILAGHAGESVFTFEWFQSRYLDNDLYDPFLSDIITCKFEDSYFDGHITTEIRGLFDTRHGGKIFWPEIGYDFQNGLSFALSYAGIWGTEGSTFENTSLFHFFKDNDIVMGTVRYEY